MRLGKLPGPWAARETRIAQCRRAGSSMAPCVTRNRARRSDTKNRRNHPRRPRSKYFSQRGFAARRRDEGLSKPPPNCSIIPLQEAIHVPFQPS